LDLKINKLYHQIRKLAIFSPLDSLLLKSQRQGKKQKKQEFAMSPIVKGLIEVKPSLLLGTLGCQPFG
jgi:hypothetical protein